MSKFVLDASAVLAYVNGEPGNALVGKILDQAVISAVNLAEVLTKLVELEEDVETSYTDLHDMGLAVVAFDDLLAVETGRLREPTRRMGLSLGDRACLATAQRLGAIAVTTDRAWAELDLPISVEVIR